MVMFNKPFSFGSKTNSFLVLGKIIIYHYYHSSSIIIIIIITDTIKHTVVIRLVVTAKMVCQIFFLLPLLFLGIAVLMTCFNAAIHSIINSSLSALKWKTRPGVCKVKECSTFWKSIPSETEYRSSRLSKKTSPLANALYNREDFEATTM